MRPKAPPFTPAPSACKAAVANIVYEYANLVSTGELLANPLAPRLNTHVQDSFLLSCRKIGDFFVRATCTKPDVLASHYLQDFYKTVSLPVWSQHRTHANVHVAHISYSRLATKQAWSGSMNNQLLLEFRSAWQAFLSTLCVKDPVLWSEFDTQLALHLQRPGFGHLNLR